jgi:hypothetical protein
MNITVKMKMIKDSDFEQYWHENLMWERTLDFYLQQNAFLKTRLSQILDSTPDKQILPKAEYFQARFIQNDASIKDMHLDIDIFRRSLENGQNDEEKIVPRYNKLNNEINNFEKTFASLKSEFNQYIVATKKAS